MRTMGDKPLIARQVGDKLVTARFVGEQLIYKDTGCYVQEDLVTQFDGRDNVGTGVHSPGSTTWLDLVGGGQGTLANASWLDWGVSFTTTTSRVQYSGANVTNYTIFNTHKIRARTGSHPRFYAEIPLPSLYLHSGNNYAYAYYGQGKDTIFTPAFVPPVGVVIQAAIRFGGTGVVELFVNGVQVASIAGVTANPGAMAAKYLGGRSTNDRTLTGEIYEHLVYNRALSDIEIKHNFLVSQVRYGIE